MHQATATATAAAATSQSISKRIIQILSNGSAQREALVLYQQLHSHGFRGSISFLPSLIKACSSSSRYLHFGLQLHCLLLKTGLASDLVTTNSLLSMYSKHSDVRSARLLFDVTPLRDSVTWNSMINCYLSSGCMLESMMMFRRMHTAGFSLKPELTASVLSVCGRAGTLSLGRAIHAYYIVSKEAEMCIPLSTSLVDMYSRCNDLDSALKVFSAMTERNVISWTAMITGSVLNDRHNMAMELFREMGVEGVKPNRATLVSLLPTCGELGALNHGRELHGYILRYGFESEPQVIGALVDMYGRFKGAFQQAKLVYEKAPTKDVITWSSMMTISNRNGDYVGTLMLFQMMQNDGAKANSVTMLALISACIGLASTCLGQAVHGLILKSGLLSKTSMVLDSLSSPQRRSLLASSSRKQASGLNEPSDWSILFERHRECSSHDRLSYLLLFPYELFEVLADQCALSYSLPRGIDDHKVPLSSMVLDSLSSPQRRSLLASSSKKQASGLNEPSEWSILFERHRECNSHDRLSTLAEVLADPCALSYSLSRGTDDHKVPQGEKSVNRNHQPLHLHDFAAMIIVKMFLGRARWRTKHCGGTRIVQQATGDEYDPTGDVLCLNRQ
ncbi:hypothetical protein Cni_G27116 [Canna indica]|uniref:Pentatricopeptide repeat-containing protein n=1 Tax=Canna indica TaxID=4628 RepID=A0AAQ3L3A9_9LILI|nr:hypothetical protein Cni_G27116 [Canna indica]